MDIPPSQFQKVLWKYKKPTKCWKCGGTWLKYKDKENRRAVCKMCGQLQ